MSIFDRGYISVKMAASNVFLSASEVSLQALERDDCNGTGTQV